ncbi:cytidine and deoxycytidylate deaminase zinc-binding region domain-containing protein [Sarocladium implicatum]|nr:cytidine and deoxycytidylate deaminase zinc-binding region domain-containing protein [Sarocladium implicatum]
MTTIRHGDHDAAMGLALDLARQSEPKPTNYRVGALLVKLADDTITAHGYTLELPGNTHAEECCLLKLAALHDVSEEDLAGVMTEPHALYTTVEPCSERLSGKLPCVERVLRQKTWIKEVYVGVTEPDTFVSQNRGRRMLTDAGIVVHHVAGMEDDILRVATAGHKRVS